MPGLGMVPPADEKPVSSSQSPVSGPQSTIGTGKAQGPSELEDKRGGQHSRMLTTRKLRIVYNRVGCIASGHCALSDPQDFGLDDEFKAILKYGKKLPSAPTVELFEKVIETNQPHLALNAARTCTPKVIAVFDVETGKRLA